MSDLREVPSPPARRFGEHELAAAYLELLRHLLCAYIRQGGACADYVEQVEAYRELEQLLVSDDTSAGNQSQSVQQFKLEAAWLRAKRATRAGVSLSRLRSLVPLFMLDVPPPDRND